MKRSATEETSTEETSTEETSTEETSTEVAVTPRAITLEEALARHNARHPEARLLDITDELRVLKITRLLELIQKRIAAGSNQEQALAQYVEQAQYVEPPETPKDREMVLSLIAAVYAMRYTLYRRRWTMAQVHEALEKTGDPVIGHAISRRINRAGSLLDCLMRTWAAREYRRKGGEAA